MQHINLTHPKAATGGVLLKNLLLKISQISRESSCFRISLLKKYFNTFFPVRLAKYLETPILKNI